MLPKMGKPVHYVHNGMGRDSYISNTHGGFMSPTVNASKGTFFNQLRAYERTDQRVISKSPSMRSISPDETGAPMYIDKFLDSKPDHFQIG